MKMPLCICGVLCSVLVSADNAVAKPTVLQTVDLTDMNMSTEGGEARLYRANGVKHGRCKIAVVHYGESGKMTYVFEFDSKLYAAEAREYRYESPIYVNPNAKSILSRRNTLASRKGRETLPKDFDTYRALFDARRLARCLGR